MDSTNISQFATGEPGKAKNFGVGFGLSNSLQKEWELNLTGQISKITYSETDLVDETRTNLQGLALYQSLSSNFSFASLVDVFQAPINRFQTQDVNNVRNQVVFAVMPSYYFAINSSDRINISYTAVDFNLENVENLPPGQASSSISQNALLNYEKRLNATNTIAINFRSADTDFDEPIETGAIDYKSNDIFLSWLVAGETDQIQVEYGRSFIVDELSREDDRPHRLFVYSRQLNRNNSITFLYQNGFNNPLSVIAATNTIRVNRANNNITAAQSNENLSFRYNLTGETLSAGIVYVESKLQQSFTENIEERTTYSANVTYLLSRTLSNSGSSNIVLGYTNQEGMFDSLQTNIRENQIEGYSVTFNYVQSPRLIVSLDYTVRDTFQTGVNDQELFFDAKSFGINFTYNDRGRF